MNTAEDPNYVYVTYVYVMPSGNSEWLDQWPFCAFKCRVQRDEEIIFYYIIWSGNIIKISFLKSKFFILMCFIVTFNGIMWVWMWSLLSVSEISVYFLHFSICENMCSLLTHPVSAFHCVSYICYTRIVRNAAATMSFGPLLYLQLSIEIREERNDW